ncbi:MAG: NAD(P)H-hydrate dehydratase [Planctomycetota bacterium]|jgi:NAD(P)H-hydrate epimerase
MTEIHTLVPFPERPADGHKGTFGRVLIIAGSRGMSGAASLAGLGALRGGAGLVYVACPLEVQPIVAGCEPSYLTIGLPNDPRGRLDGAAWETIEPVVASKDAVAVGPGLGNCDATGLLVRRLYSETDGPLIVDADGLNAIAADFESGAIQERAIRGPRILTPHPGEFSRLSGISIGDINRQREKVAREFAERYHVVLVLKGPGTIVTDGSRAIVNPTGNSGMATGGSGDVLTGLIAALAAQGLEPFEAARLGVYLHGLAGDLAADELSEQGLIASDLPQFLPKAWLKLRSERNSHAE